jgi:hypothetical protein
MDPDVDEPGLGNVAQNERQQHAREDVAVCRNASLPLPRLASNKRRVVDHFVIDQCMLGEVGGDLEALGHPAIALTLFLVAILAMGLVG